MRILHVLEPSDGGVAVYVRDLSRELLKRGHRVDAVVSDRPGPFPGELGGLGIGVARVPFRAELGTVRDDARTLHSLASLLRRRRWDVVHTHGNKGGVLARPPARLLGLPVVHSTHGFDYLTQRGRPRQSTEARRTLTLTLERMLAPCARRILCASAYDRDNALRDGIGRPDQFAVIPNGVARPETIEPDPRLACLQGEGPLVGFMARLHEGKGPLEFLDAVARVRDGGVRIRAAVVGNGPLEREVRDLATSLGLDDVPVLPFDGDPFSALAAFDVYVLPSRWEVFGLTIAEAMSVSVPVIATDVGGIPELVSDGESGMLVAPGDGDGMAGAINALALDAPLRERMGAAGHTRWEARFCHSAMVEAVEAAYTDAIEAR